MKPTLLVLAAGMGSRYGGLKQIDPVGPDGETIIDYSIYDALRAGFGKRVFVIRQGIAAQFKALVGARFESRLPVEYVFQELDSLPAGFTVPASRAKPWGTTHAILMGDSAVHEPFAVINADDFYGAQSFRLLAQHLQSGTPDYAMAGFVLRNTLSDFGAVARGVCQVDGGDCLRAVVEHTKIVCHGNRAYDDGTGHESSFTGDEKVSMNMWGFTPAVFPQLRQYFGEFLNTHSLGANAECYIPSAVTTLIHAGRVRVKVLRTSEAWFGVTYREDLPRVTESIRQLIARGDYPKRLWT